MKLLLLFLYDYQSQSKPHVPYHSASAQKLTVNEKRIWKEENIVLYKEVTYIYI